MILLGVLLAYFDVAAGMILFSIIQFFVNGAPVIQWRDYVRWPIFYWYFVGAVAAFAIMWTIAYVPDKATAAMRPNIEWRGVPVITGFLTTVVQILAGVGGLMLDIFFQKSMLDRKTTNATKAVAQTFSYVIRWVYFGAIAGMGDLPLWIIPPSVLLGIGGAWGAPYVVERMTDHGFRQWTRAIIFMISTVYLLRAGYLFWKG
jgi:uncharacterized membrane protein YfcA